MNVLHALLIPAIAIIVAAPPGAAADEHPDESAAHLQRRTRSEIRDFLKARAPESLDHLQHAEEEGHQEVLDQFWSEAARLVGQYYHTREELGEEAAATYLKLRRMEFVADRLTERFHHTSDPAAAEATAKQLRAVLGDHLDATLHLERVHLAQARRELDKAAAELEETAARRARIINDEYKRRLFGRSEVVEHDHGDHREKKPLIETDAEEESERLRDEPEHPEDVEPDHQEAPDEGIAPEDPSNKPAQEPR